MRSNGEEMAKDSLMCGSLLKAAVNDVHSPNEGFAIHTISQGRTPLTKKTLKKIPQIKNHLRPFLVMVAKTSAFTTALSRLETTSKTQRPKTLNIRGNKCMIFIAKTAL